MENINNKDRLILALDPKLEDIKEMMKTMGPDLVKKKVEENVIEILDELKGQVGFVKINYVYAIVPGIINLIKSRGFKVWLDGKYKDIPRSVEGWTIGAVLNKVDMITVHADGGYDMVRYSTEIAKMVKGLKQYGDMKVLAISVLTSIDDRILNEELEIEGKVLDKVVIYAKLAEKAGADGIVASAKEAPILRRVLKKETIIVTPGIKPLWAAAQKDQKRVTTPYQAITNGSDYLVVGSAIIKAVLYGKSNKADAAQAIVAEIGEGVRVRQRK